MTDLPTKTYTEFCQGNLPADFTGVVYSDTGKRNYGAVVNGKMLKDKRNMNRWFKYEMEAGRAAYAAAWTTDTSGLIDTNRMTGEQRA